MTILCIETSTSVCSAAICKDGVPVKQCINYEGSNHARLLPLYIKELLSFAREQGLFVEAVALSEGPGSYTGLRIGTSTAKGLCYGLQIPLIPVPTLEVLVRNYELRMAKDGHPVSHAVLFPMIDARRMEVYTKGPSDKGQRDNVQCTKEKDVRAVVVESEESLIKGQRDNVQCTKETEYYYFGDGAAKCQPVLTAPNWHFVPEIVPEAQYVGVLAEELAADDPSARISGQQLAYYEPFYLKEFQAAPSHIKGLK